MLDRPTHLDNHMLVRPALPDDRQELDALRCLSLQRLLAPLLEKAQWRTVVEHTPFDPTLIEDGTYYVLEIDGRIAASGGWSRRAALYRLSNADGQTDRFLDPAQDAAIIRAMFTHPDFVRLGLGSVVLSVAEAAARLAGFAKGELIATPTGRKLYLARGWRVSERIAIGHTKQSSIDVSLMEKAF